MFFKKRKEECPHKEFTKDCFKRVKHSTYFGYSAGKSEWESWDLVKASGRFVEIPTKTYEVLVGDEVTWISEAELKWPKC